MTITVFHRSTRLPRLQEQGLVGKEEKLLNMQEAKAEETEPKAWEAPECSVGEIKDNL